MMKHNGYFEWVVGQVEEFERAVLLRGRRQSVDAVPLNVQAAQRRRDEELRAEFHEVIRREVQFLEMNGKVSEYDTYIPIVLESVKAYTCL
jgi:hypothetical protein